MKKLEKHSLIVMVAALALTLAGEPPVHSQEHTQTPAAPPQAPRGEKDQPPPLLQPPEPKGLSLFESFNCYSFQTNGPLRCAMWSLRLLPDSTLAWTVRLTNMQARRTYYADVHLMDQAQRHHWISALKKALKWARLARRQKVDLDRMITETKEGVKITFVAKRKGGFCSLRFAKRGWLDQGPIYMEVPYVGDTLEPRSMSSLLEGLTKGDRVLRRKLQAEQRKERMFK